MNIAELPIPKHLREFLIPFGDSNNELKVRGKIKCRCNSEDFILNFYGEKSYYNKERVLKSQEFHDGCLIIVEVNCIKCSSNHLIFDSDNHGWGGWMLESQTLDYDRPKLEAWKCNVCSESNHKLEVELQSDGKEGYKSETGDPNDSNDWKEAFGWIILGITCNSCGETNSDWISYETM